MVMGCGSFLNGAVSFEIQKERSFKKDNDLLRRRRSHSEIRDGWPGLEGVEFVDIKAGERISLQQFPRK